MNEKPALTRLIRYAKDDRKNAIWASIYSFANKVFDIAPEILIGFAIDVVVSKQNSFVARMGIEDPWHQVIALGVLTLVIWVCESLFEYLHLISWRNLAQNIQHKLRTDVYSHVQNLDMAYFEDQSSGNLVSVLNDDVNQLERFLDGGANDFIQTLTAVVLVGAVFIFISPTIAWVAFMPIPLVIVGAFYFQKRAVPMYAQVREKVGLLASRLNNNIAGILSIKSFTREAQQAQLLRDESLAYVQANHKAIAVSSAFTPIIRMAVLAGFLATFLLGGWKVLQGDLRVGMYGVLVFLTQRLLWPLTRLATTVDLYERAMASTRRILDLKQVPIEIVSGHFKPDKLKGTFVLKNVDFKYQTGGPVLKDISLHIPAKKTVAFVGATGSGKSTLIKLLSRYYEPTSGDVWLDARPLSDYDLQSLRQRIGLVSQDTYLFHGSVKENLLFGQLEASDEQLIEAATMAEAHDFIQALPEGYDTIIGERGQKLSGGQRQRLSIARAIVKNPDVLILDEATSAVDNETEAAIQRAMIHIAKNRTTIMIAHRLSTVVQADQIYVLEQGRIVQEGKHAQLLSQEGPYRQLWQVQTGQR
jgi:ATP-binding cassette subfamily B protein